MALKRDQEARLTRLRVLGGESPIRLDDCELGALACIALHDLGERLPDFCNESELPRYAFNYYEIPIKDVRCPNCGDFRPFYAETDGQIPDFGSYFEALATLHKRRRKYRRILETQSIPAFVTVEPRALLEYGVTVRGADAPTADALASWLVLRKFLFDLDNRSAQETGYLFEPLIALAIGGVPYGARESPVRRKGNPHNGRQVDCIKDKVAYEFKLRVTIAASGQGRWGEELQFPEDCEAYGFIPVLVVLDPTENPKLTELQAAFAQHGGRSYVGTAAWDLLDREAGNRMATFLHKYVRSPMAQLDEVRGDPLLPLTLRPRDPANINNDAEQPVPVEVELGGVRLPLR